MTSPMRPDDDRDIEQRLQASWSRAVSRAEHDLADRDLVSTALEAGGGAARRRGTGLVLGLAVVAVAVVALVVGLNGLRLPNTTAASPLPISTPTTPTGSPAPSASVNPDGVTVPVLDPNQTFPPSVDGTSVVQVGPEADARIAAATDDAPIYLSGWLVSGDWNWIDCAEENGGVPAPDGTLGPDCIGTLLRAAADGGPALRIFSTIAARPYLVLVRPGPARAQPVLVQVHVRDPQCEGSDCARMPVLDRVLMYGAVMVAPGLLTSAMPPGGITAEQAIESARRQLVHYPPPAPGQLPVLRVAVGTAQWLDDQAGDQPARWEWVVNMVLNDGYTERVEYVDYMDGTVFGGGSGPIGSGASPVLDPGQTFPSSVDGEPVVQVGSEADARIAAATDDSPIFVSGWLLGTDQLGCSASFDLGTPASNGVYFKECMAILLRATGDGGASLPIFSTPTMDNLALPGRSEQRPVLLQVHVRDRGCAAADCAFKPVLDRVVMYGAARIAPVYLAAQPSSGISLDEAVVAARQYLNGSSMVSGVDLVLLSAEAGPVAVVDEQGGANDTTWIWAVTFATADGFETYTADVDYRDGTTTRAHGGSVMATP